MVALHPLPTTEAAPLSPREQAYFDGLVTFVETLPPAEVAQVGRLAELGRTYGVDVDAERADWDAGRHPFQRQR